MDANPQVAWDRSETNGFRLITPPEDTTGLAAADIPVLVPTRDFVSEDPVTDEIFAVYRGLFEYDPTPLEARVEATDTTAEWIREEITFEAPYGPERMKAHLFLPLERGAALPVVVYWPGSGVLRISAPAESVAWLRDHIGFLVKSGRAVVMPVFKASLDRSDGFRYRLQDDTRAYRDHVIMWGKDLRRTLDYVEARPDLDKGTIGYFGYSWGARMGGIMLALEPRITAAVLYIGGLSPLPVQPEADPFNYLPRVTQPVLMLNGKFDSVYPVATSVLPFFDRLGTPIARKRSIVSDGGHFIPRPQLIRETLDWFDMYLLPSGGERR